MWTTWIYRLGTDWNGDIYSWHVLRMVAPISTVINDREKCKPQQKASTYG